MIHTNNTGYKASDCLHAAWRDHISGKGSASANTKDNPMIDD